MKIIYISGIDGCGKTTQATLLVDWLSARGISAEYQWLRWEPSLIPVIRMLKRLLSRKTTSVSDVKSENLRDGKWGRFKARLLSGNFARKIWLSYAVNDYLRSYRKASRTWLSDYVVLDRYSLDFLIDQALNLSISPSELHDILSTGNFAKMKTPDFSILIDLPADVGYKRKLDGTSLRYLKQREELYRNAPVNDPVLHVDGTQTVEKIHADITGWINDRGIMT